MAFKCCMFTTSLKFTSISCLSIVRPCEPDLWPSHCITSEYVVLPNYIITTVQSSVLTHFVTWALRGQLTLTFHLLPLKQYHKFLLLDTTIKLSMSFHSSFITPLAHMQMKTLKSRRLTLRCWTSPSVLEWTCSILAPCLKSVRPYFRSDTMEHSMSQHYVPLWPWPLTLI